MTRKYLWLKLSFLFFGIFVFAYSYVAAFGDELGICHMSNGMKKCFIGYNSFIDSIGFLSISFVIVSLFLFLIKDSIFKKWLKFALIWLLASAFSIAITPGYSGGWMDVGPDREDVSILLASLFVIISLAMMISGSLKERRSGKRRRSE